MKHDSTLCRFGLFVGEWFVTSEAALQHIFARKPERMRVVPESTQAEVAAVAEKTSQFPGFVAVIKGQPPAAVVPTTDIAIGVARDDNCLLIGQAVFAHRLPNITALRRPAISPPVRRAALLAVLQPIFAHALRMALSAVRLAPLRGDIVEAEIAQREGVGASATGLLFHLRSVAQTVNPSKWRRPYAA